MEEDKKENSTENVNTQRIEETKPQKDKKGFCIASLVLGIVAIVFFCLWYLSIPCGILAIIFGILGIKSTGKGMAIAGLITGAIGLVVSIIIIIILFIVGFTIGISNSLDEIDSGYHSYYDYY